VTVLHSCATPSRLRFTIPGARSKLLDVLEADQEPSSLGVAPATSSVSDGGGLARSRACPA
jgi:hypothetical protein